MPFKSEAERRFMWLKHPDIAKRWSKEHPNQKNLPQHVKPKKASHVLTGQKEK